MMAHENNTVNKGAQKLKLSNHVVDASSEFSSEKYVNRVHTPNRTSDILANSISQTPTAGSTYFKSFELAVIKRLQSDLVKELEALNFETAEVIFEELLEHMSESELEQIMVENGTINLAAKQFN